MQIAARYQAAIEVLDQITAGLAAERALTQWARSSRFAGSKDRAAVRDHVYDVLRNRGRAAHLGGAETGRALILGLLRLQGVDVDQVFTGQGHAPAPLDSTDAALPETPAVIACDTPDWLREKLAPVFGSALDDVLALMGGRAPVYLRVNLKKADRDDCIAQLGGEEITAIAVTGSQTALEVTQGTRKLRNSAAYLDGLIEFQDLSVQLAVEQVAWPQTGRVLDYCAGGGGKALAIAALSDARIDVHDAKPERMVDIPMRAQRAGLDLRAVEGKDLAAGGYDLVLCDVPCSGSGTWRRDPEARWRLDAEGLAYLCTLQAEILDQAVVYLGENGRLVYMTCSLLAEENEAQIEGFLSRHPDFSLVQEVRFDPRAQSDGFYMAELSRP